MAKLIIMDLFDVSADTVFNTTESQSVDDVFGQLVKKRTFILNDPKGKYNPFHSKSIFSNTGWRGQKVEFLDDAGELEFSGTMQAIRVSDLGYIKQTIIEAFDPLATILDFEADSQLILSGFTVNGANALNASLVNLVNGGAVNFAKPAYISFKNKISPRYLVTSTTGVPPVAVNIERGLEEALVNGDLVRISQPVYKSPTQEIRDAIFAADRGRSITFGSSFDTLAGNEILNNRLLWINLRVEDRVKLRDHLAKILEMADLNLYQPENGLLEIRQGRETTGIQFTKITTAEIIKKSEPEYDMTRLLAGYDLLFVDGTGVSMTSRRLTEAQYDRWANKALFQPNGIESSLLNYKYLYNSMTTARFYGDRVLDYNVTPRTVFKFDIKAFQHDKPKQKIKLYAWKDVQLSLPIFTDSVNEPATVLSYDYDERSQTYTGVRIALTNKVLGA